MPLPYQSSDDSRGGNWSPNSPNILNSPQTPSLNQPACTPQAPPVHVMEGGRGEVLRIRPHPILNLVDLILAQAKRHRADDAIDLAGIARADDGSRHRRVA